MRIVAGRGGVFGTGDGLVACSRRSSPICNPTTIPATGFLVIRGRPLSVEGLLTAAARTLVEFSWRGEPVAAVSAEVTGPDRSTDDVLAGSRLRTRRSYAATPVANLIDRGFPVLATFVAPHVSIVLPEYTEAHVRTLIEVLGPEQPNPYYMRTPR